MTIPMKTEKYKAFLASTSNHEEKKIGLQLGYVSAHAHDKS